MTDQEQIEEMANISTKEEIEARNKRGKEKDELRQALLHYATAEASGGIKSLIDCEGCAFYLYENLGYRKLPKDSVVLSKEEFAEIQKQVDELKERLHLIWAIGIDYDGFEKSESLKELIDEMVELTRIESKDKE